MARLPFPRLRCILLNVRWTTRAERDWNSDRGISLCAGNARFSGARRRFARGWTDVPNMSVPSAGRARRNIGAAGAAYRRCGALYLLVSPVSSAAANAAAPANVRLLSDTTSVSL